jgi:hypothetical protein
MDEAWRLERESWTAASAGEAEGWFARVMTSDAFVVLPGQVLNREDVLKRWSVQAPWVEYSLGTPRLVLVDGQTCLVSYRVSARDPENGEYRALVTSLYTWVGGGWALAFRQHTPDDGTDPSN